MYVWHGRGDLQALHFDWDKHEANYSESIAVEKIILTETDSLLRDYPGHFKIARFNDHAFWKGPRPTPNARQQAKEDARRQKEQYYKQEEFWRDEFKRSQYQQPPPHNYNQQPPPNVGDAFRDAFNRIFEEEMRRQRARQQQTYNQRPNRYSAPTGDQWFTLMMQGGTKEEARRVYKDLAKQHHPDVNKADDATATMQAINRAYDQVMRILS